MSDADMLPAPKIQLLPGSDPKWEREYRKFLQLRPSLLPKYRGKYVAIHQGKVVESGDDQLAVALRAYAKHGYVPIYVGLVSDDPPKTARIPSPRSYP
jgi:hypothetical protein